MKTGFIFRRKNNYENKRRLDANIVAAVPLRNRNDGKGSEKICGFFAEIRSEVLADSSDMPDQLRGLPVPVFFQLCGQPVFYRLGIPVPGETVKKIRVRIV
jgi:hypothetical protein